MTNMTNMTNIPGLIVLTPEHLSSADKFFQKLTLCHIIAKNKSFVDYNIVYHIIENENIITIKSDNIPKYYIEKSKIDTLSFADILNNKINISDDRYYVLMEDNEHEGESWYFYGSYSIKGGDIRSSTKGGDIRSSTEGGDIRSSTESEEKWNKLFKSLVVPYNWNLVDYNLNPFELEKFIDGPSNTNYLSTYNYGNDITYDNLLGYVNCEDCNCEENTGWYKGSYDIECNCEKEYCCDILSKDNEVEVVCKYSIRKYSMTKWLNLFKSIDKKLKTMSCKFEVYGEYFLSELDEGKKPDKELDYKKLKIFLKCDKCNPDLWTKTNVLECLCV